MSMMSRLMGMGKVKEHHTYGLTPLGKTKAEQYSAPGPTAEVLSYLDTNGASSVNEIAGEVKVSPQKIKLILRDLIRSGYARKVSQED